MDDMAYALLFKALGKIAENQVKIMVQLGIRDRKSDKSSVRTETEIISNDCMQLAEEIEAWNVKKQSR